MSNSVHKTKAAATVKTLTATFDGLINEIANREADLNGLRAQLNDTRSQLIAARALYSGLVLADGGDIDPATVPQLFLSETQTPPQGKDKAKTDKKVVEMPQQGTRERARRLRRREQESQPTN